jgi:hypothetical protein
LDTKRVQLYSWYMSWWGHVERWTAYAALLAMNVGGMFLLHAIVGDKGLLMRFTLQTPAHAGTIPFLWQEYSQTNTLSKCSRVG